VVGPKWSTGSRLLFVFLAITYVKIVMENFSFLKNTAKHMETYNLLSRFSQKAMCIYTSCLIQSIQRHRKRPINTRSYAMTSVDLNCGTNPTAGNRIFGNFLLTTTNSFMVIAPFLVEFDCLIIVSALRRTLATLSI
jgi:hypothetical protein